MIKYTIYEIIGRAAFSLLIHSGLEGVTEINTDPKRKSFVSFKITSSIGRLLSVYPPNGTAG